MDKLDKFTLYSLHTLNYDGSEFRKRMWDLIDSLKRKLDNDVDKLYEDIDRFNDWIDNVSR